MNGSDYYLASIVRDRAEKLGWQIDGANADGIYVSGKDGAMLGGFKTVEELYGFMCGYDHGYARGYLRGVEEERVKEPDDATVRA